MFQKDALPFRARFTVFQIFFSASVGHLYAPNSLILRTRSKNLSRYAENLGIYAAKRKDELENESGIYEECWKAELKLPGDTFHTEKCAT